jgi:hypothetical protein
VSKLLLRAHTFRRIAIRSCAAPAERLERCSSTWRFFVVEHQVVHRSFANFLQLSRECFSASWELR